MPTTVMLPLVMLRDKLTALLSAEIILLTTGDLLIKWRADPYLNILTFSRHF